MSPEPSQPQVETWLLSKQRLLYLMVHLWLVYHLFAVMVAPASVPPTSDALRGMWGGFRHYLEASYFNHGYHYFAPSPGNSTLLRYVAKYPDGRSVVGQVPDRNEHRPRLLYHRHFMLTEYLASLPPELDEVREALAESYAFTIAEKLDASQLELSKVTHRIIPAERIIAGGAIDDAETYESEPLIVIERATR